MINLIRTFYLLYKATKKVNVVNVNGLLQVYNGVENENYLYFVISKDVCNKYGLEPDLQFMKKMELKDE